MDVGFIGASEATSGHCLKKGRCFATALSMILSIAACRCPELSEAVSVSEYEVYTACLKHLGWTPSEEEQIVVANPPFLLMPGESTAATGTPVSVHTFNELCRRTAAERCLEDGFFFTMPVSLLSINRGGDTSLLESAVFWEDFPRMFPRARGIVAVSRVAFDLKRRTAMVQVGMFRGPHTGEAHEFELTEDNGSWKVLAVLRTIVAP